MKLFSESISVTNLTKTFSTAASTASNKVEVKAGEKVAFLCQYGGATAPGAWVSATVVNMAHFSVLESTGCTDNGSAVSGATLALGASTANQLYGVNIGVIQVTSALTTAAAVTVCGESIHTTAVGADGETVAAQLSGIINAHSVLSRKVNAFANAGGATGIVTLTPKMGCTGISLLTADASYVVGHKNCIGCIELDVTGLSTNYPKYVGVSLSTVGGATAIRSVDLVKFPAYKPSFAGKSVII